MTCEINLQIYITEFVRVSPMSDCKSQDFGLLYKVKLALNLHALAFITRYFSQARIIIVKDVKSESIFSFVETLRD